MQSWYIYYKLTEPQLLEQASVLQALVQQIATLSGVRGRLQRRTEVKDGKVTLMEIYEDIADPAGFGLLLENTVAGFRAHGLSSEKRHTERFADLQVS